SGPFPDPQEEGGPEVEEPLGVHHALAERASKYTKRPNVFRLQTADWRVFLFQAPTLEEMFSWISRINLVAALFSSPPFPAAVGSQRRFVRPILPAAPSRSAPEEQHRSHEAWMERVAQELFEHQRNLPEKRGRARDLDEYRLKKEYLLYE
ncbi:PSD4 protein, partial [Herpetotheres cachinnans]|nr:PSD4 protein [Herpetotheres cachinnans]